MRVFLIGAGASHSYDQSPTGIKPPLARDFFQTYRNLDIAADRFVRVGSIINYVRDTRGLNPLEFGEWEENLEDFLTEIDEKIGTKEAAEKLNLGDMFQFSQAYDQMIFLFASVLNEIQNGPCCKNYSALCGQLSDNDVLVTFNWDTLLDQALFENGKWFPDDGYGLPFRKIFRDGWGVLSGAQSSKFQLLKLHGSTNWIMPYFTLDYRDRERRFANPTIDPNGRPMFCFHYATKEFLTYHNRSKAGYEPFSYYYYPPDIPVRTDSQAPKGWKRMSIVAADVPEYGVVRMGGYPTVSMPLIIPPVRNKKFGLLGNALDGLWENAERAIKECEQLVIIGYSFPITDIRSWSLIENAIAGKSSALQIVLIDPHPAQLAERLQERYGEKIKLEVFDTTFNQLAQINLS